MSDLRSRVIRLAYEKPELREHLLPVLKVAAGKPIVDPETGMTYAQLRKHFELTLNAMYDELKAGNYRDRRLSEKLKQYQKDMGSRVDRLRLREEKAKMGLRLSSRPKDVADHPKTGDFSYLGNAVVSAILRGNEVVGWVISKSRSVPVSEPGKSYSYGSQKVTDHTPYTLDGQKIPGVLGMSKGSTKSALEAFHSFLTTQANAGVPTP